jgi:restriction endonuclease S subunit
METRKIRVSDVCDINLKSLKGKKIPNKIFYLDTGSITKNIIYKIQNLSLKISSYPSRAKRIVKKNTILYSSVRPIQEHHGILINPEENLIVSTGFITLDIKKENQNEIDPKFFYHCLTRKNITNHLHRIAVNNVTSYPSISPEDLGEIEFEIPIDIQYQKKISNLLSMYDDKINTNNKIISEIDNFSKTLFSYWFLQFDFPDTGKKPYKSNGGEMVWNATLKKNIPSNWNVEKLRNIIKEDKNGDWGKDKPEKNYSKKVICIRGSDIYGLDGIEELKPPIRFISNKKQNNFLEEFDIMIEMSGGSPTQSTGRINLISNKTLNRFNLPIICSNFCKPISIKKDKYVYYFLFLWKFLYEQNTFFKFEGKTSGIKNLLFDIFVDTCPYLAPSQELIEIFFNAMHKHEYTKQSLIAEIAELNLVRDELFILLINGQARIE